MLEGATIHRTAAALRPALVDQKMTYFEAPRLVGVVPRAGRTIEHVEGRGRQLDIEWDDGVVLHTHLRMSGSWHLYRTGQCWMHNHRDVRALVEVDGWVAVCFNAPVVETYRRPDATRHPGLRGVGPDLSRPDADLRRCIDALLAHDDPRASISEVLLDERVFCGVGNVYRSEVLWACALSPFARVGELPEPEAVRVVNLAAKLLRANLRHAHRVSVLGDQGGLAVYGRAGQPCPRCATTIRARRPHGRTRTLYWCPGCQVRHDPRQTAAHHAVLFPQHRSAGSG
jgi:endonuclease-8